MRDGPHQFIYITDFLPGDDAPLSDPKPTRGLGYAMVEDVLNDFYLEDGKLKSKTIEARKNNRILKKLRQR